MRRLERIRKWECGILKVEGGMIAKKKELMFSG
jgi:hypothetical protein